MTTLETKTTKRPAGVSRLALAWLIGSLLIGSFCIYKAAPGNHISPRSPYRLKGIAEFTSGDTVLALNHETGEMERRRVVQTFRRTSDHLFILAVRGEDGTTQIIKTTDEHPFWVVGKSEYVEAKDLQIGDRFHGADGKLHTLTGTRYEPHSEGIAVYNLEVDGLHNYFVTLNGGRAPPVLAHNANPSDYIPGGSHNAADFARYKDQLRAAMSKPHVTDPDLARYMDELYRPGATIGSGSTAAAVRHELATGGTVGGRTHSQKARDMITALQRWLNNNPHASHGDRAAAENVIRDMINALDGN